jgi:hypothetical protein
MMTNLASLPHAVYRVFPKRGENDCAVAALAIVLKRDYEDVLIAAAKISPTVWRAGLHGTDMIKVAKRLGVAMRWKPQLDPDEDIGVLWVSHRDSTKEHCVVLLEGWILEPEHNPVSLWRVDEYYAAQNAFANSLLEVVK